MQTDAIWRTGILKKAWQKRMFVAFSTSHNSDDAQLRAGEEQEAAEAAARTAEADDLPARRPQWL